VSRYPRKKTDGLDYSTFRKRVKERDISPLYLFLGEEAYLQKRALDHLYESIDEGSRPFNVELISIGAETPSGRKATMADAIDAANQLPMMAARRIVVVREFDKIKEDEQQIVLDYLKNPCQTTSLVFQATSLDQRRKLSGTLMKGCTVVAFDALAEGPARTWAEKYLNSLNCKAQKKAIETLVRLAGTSLMVLSNELDKLAAWAGPDGEVTVEAVELLVGRGREHTSWELWDAILQNNRLRAVRLLERLLDDGDGGTPLMVNGALASLYRKLLTGKELLAKGASSSEVARATGQYGQREAPFKAWLAKTPLERIVHGLRRISEVDNAIKNSEGTARLQMEYLIAELTLPVSEKEGVRRPSG
jgi:DNA polymerase-3 subunit delta